MLAALLAALTLAAPGEIFGDIRSGDTYLADVGLTLTCGDETVRGRTDSSGSFRLRTTATGRCRLTLSWKDQSPSVDVVVFARPTRYRFVVEEQDGALVLKRV